jgi:hypothetical protein
MLLDNIPDHVSGREKLASVPSGGAVAVAAGGAGGAAPAAGKSLKTALTIIHSHCTHDDKFSAKLKKHK